MSSNAYRGLKKKRFMRTIVLISAKQSTGRHTERHTNTCIKGKLVGQGRKLFLLGGRETL